MHSHDNGSTTQKKCAQLPTLPCTLPEDAKLFLESCLQRDFGLRPNARTLMTHALFEHVTHHPLLQSDRVNP